MVPLVGGNIPAGTMSSNAPTSVVPLRLLDHTTLDTFERCEVEAVYKYRDHIESGRPSAALTFGSAVHAGIRTFYDAAPYVQTDVMLDAVTAAWGTAEFPDDEWRSLAYARDLVAMYADVYKPSSWDFSLVMNEEYLEDGEECGIVDRVVRRKLDGLLYVKDTKAQPLTSLVLTPEGWKFMGDLQVGEAVIGADGMPTTIVAVAPQGKQDCYRITFTDRSYVRCSKEHLWKVASQYRKDKDGELIWQVMTLEEIMAQPPYQHYQVPLPLPIAHPHRELPIDPYLLGSLLGDGYLAGNSVQFSTSELEMALNVASVLPDDVTLKKGPAKNYSHSLTGPNLGGKSNSLQVALRSLGLYGSLSHTKFVPQVYKFSSVEQRVALLQGLLDTDGCTYHGSLLYDTVSLRLMEDVIDLVRSLGGMARFRTSAPSQFSTHTKYRANLRLPKQIMPFKLERKLRQYNLAQNRKPLSRYIASVEKEQVSEEMQCIKVTAPDGLYVTDQYIVTHNTTGWWPSPAWQEQWRHSQQAARYLQLAEAKLGKAIAGFWGDVIYTNKRGYPKREDFVSVGPFPYSAALRAELAEQRARKGARLRAVFEGLAQPLKNTHNCFRFNSQCCFLRFCVADPADRADMLELAVATGELRTKEWNPKERD